MTVKWCAGVLPLALFFGLAGPVAAQPPQADGKTRWVPQDDEVLDRVTGLVWRRCAEGQVWTGTQCAGTAMLFSWQEALDRAQAAAGGGLAWRLPNVKELASLVDERRSSPAIDVAAFPDTPSTWFRSSTHLVGDPPFYAWTVYFFQGGNYTSRNQDLFAVRLVRTPD